jgi:DNA repair exonuclease SbcCD ATPase subunit
MATLFFIAIYIFLFEIFIQRAKISENETMRKAKILFIFTLSIFSAIAIGYAIPFLLNLYGLILLILLLIALFFFGRATISYGKSFHYATKSLAVNVEKDLVNLEKELKEAKKYIPQEYAKSLTEGIEKIRSIYDEAENTREAADKKFQNILSNIIKEHENFINSLIKEYKEYLNRNKLNDAQVKKMEDLIKYLENERNIDKSKIENVLESIRKIHDNVLNYNESIANFASDDKAKVELRNTLNNILNKVYNDTLSKYKQISLEIENVIDEYMKARTKLNTLYSYEKGLNDIGLRVRKSLGVHGNRKAEIGMLSTLKELKNDIEKTRSSINERIQFLENLKNLLR